MTRDDLAEVLGEVDDLLAARILATGASRGELVEALAAIERGNVEGEPAPDPSSRRVAQVRELLEEPLVQERLDDEEDRPPG